jgi:hypothetical protein
MLRKTQAPNQYNGHQEQQLFERLDDPPWPAEGVKAIEEKDGEGDVSEKSRSGENGASGEVHSLDLRNARWREGEHDGCKVAARRAANVVRKLVIYDASR